MSEAQKGNKNCAGRKHSEETKRRIAESNSRTKRGVPLGPLSEETRQKIIEAWTPEKRAQISADRRGLRYGQEAAGSFVALGYRNLTTQYGHPLANSSGVVSEHRRALYDKIGPGLHPCHWGCGKVLEWGGILGICVDHLDDDKVNNDPDNLVPSCLVCNMQRGK